MDFFGSEEPAQSSEQEKDLCALDEMFLARRYRSSREYMELLRFIARFRRYAPQLYAPVHPESGCDLCGFSQRLGAGIQPPSQTQRTPLDHPPPFGPVMFLYDLQDTEGDPIPDPVLKRSTRMANCHGVSSTTSFIIAGSTGLKYTTLRKDCPRRARRYVSLPKPETITVSITCHRRQTT